MIVARIEDNPSLKAVIHGPDSVIFAKINSTPSSIRATIHPQDQILRATIIQKTEQESYYETGNEAGGNTIIIGD